MMLNRQICKSCRLEFRRNKIHFKEIDGNVQWWNCVIRYGTGNAAICIKDDPPAGCRKLFEYALLHGVDSAK
jgi:hypothetical protein